MGVDAVDVDDDGDLDLLVVNLDGESDSFFRNQGKFFVDDTVSVGLRTPSRPFTRFGMALRDFDNDGYLDLYEANGRVGRQSELYSPDPYAEPSLLFRGAGRTAVRGGGAARRYAAAAHRLEPRRRVRRHRQRRRGRRRGREPRQPALPAAQRRAAARPLELLRVLDEHGATRSARKSR